MENLDKAYPVIDTVMRYLQIVSNSLYSTDKKRVKEKLMQLLLNSIHLSHIPFYKIWILEALRNYKEVIDIKDQHAIISSYNYQDPFTKRQIILLLGELNCIAWFRSMERNYYAMDSWQKRAYLKGLSDCQFSPDELRPLIKTFKPTIKDSDTYLFNLPIFKSI